MPIKLTTYEERMSVPPKINIAIFGKPGVGKTWQAKFLPPEKTLFIDGEAGTLSLKGWKGTTLDIRKEAAANNVTPWEMCQMIALVLHGGPDPAAKSGPYTQEKYEKAVQVVGEPSFFDQFEYIFVDSITVVSRWSYAAQAQSSEHVSEKTGNFDPRSAYGAHGTAMVEWLTMLQHQPKSIIVACILDEKEDDFGRKVYAPQLVGGMTKDALPGIFDINITLEEFTLPKEKPDDEEKKFRAFVVEHMNPYGLIAKCRGDALGPGLEEPNIYKAIQKIRAHQHEEETNA